MANLGYKGRGLPPWRGVAGLAALLLAVLALVSAGPGARRWSLKLLAIVPALKCLGQALEAFLHSRLGRSLFGDSVGLARVALAALRSGQLFWPACTLEPPISDVLTEYDVKIPTSVGTLLANVFKPKSKDGEKLPVVMCMHPYDNHLLPALHKTPLGGCPQQYRIVPQAGKPKFSTQTSWESPDVNFWVSHGYAVVNVNAPGYAGSGGKPQCFQDDQAKAYYEAIEWVAAQDWSTGKVGLNGVSFLAITQWQVAACRAFGGKAPPALKCICPWEGFSDPRRDLMMPGGVEESGFLAFWWTTEVKDTLTSRNPQDFIDSVGCTPLEFKKQSDAWWREMTPDLENITVPMLVCGSFSDHGLHSTGSFRGFMQASSKEKWLYTHRTGKWDSYYSAEVQQLTLQFFDYYLKGVENDWKRTPRVRLEVRKSRDVIHEVREEPDWPLRITEYRKLYLMPDMTLGMLGKPVGGQPAKAAKPVPNPLPYNGNGGSLVFNYKFMAPTEWTGYMKLHLAVEVKDTDDMAIFAALRKLDMDGNFVGFYGSTGLREDAVTRGCMLASMHALDEGLSTEYQPVISYKRQLLKAGEILELDLALEPSSTFFDAGEGVELVISSQEVVPTGPYVKSLMQNRGTHIIHAAASYLVVPDI